MKRPRSRAQSARLQPLASDPDWCNVENVMGCVHSRWDLDRITKEGPRPCNPAAVHWFLTRATGRGGVTGDRWLANAVGACRAADLRLVSCRLQSKATLSGVTRTQHHLSAMIPQQEENQPFFSCEHVCENTAQEQSLKSLMLMCVHPSQFPLWLYI